MKELSHHTPILTPTPTPTPARYLIPRPSTTVALEELIFGVSFMSAFALLQLPYEQIDGNPVPTVVFKGRPSFFHAFLLGLNFAFTGAVLTISLRSQYPKLARYCRQLAVSAIATSVGIVMFLALPLLLLLALFTSFCLGYLMTYWACMVFEVLS